MPDQSRENHSRRGAPARCTCLALALAAALLPGAQLTGAEVYKWVDENGRVHYGDKPPDQQSTPMHLDTQPPAGADGGARQEKQQKLLDTFSEERDEHRREVEAAAQEKKKRLANCEQVRKYLADLTRANYLYKEGSDPANPQVLTDQEREAELKKGQDAVKKWCGPGG